MLRRNRQAASPNTKPEVRVADLGAIGAVALAGRLAGAFDEPRVGEEVTPLLEALDRFDLLEDHRRQKLADARHRAQAVEGVGVMRLGGAHDAELEFVELGIVEVDEPLIEFDPIV